MSVLQLSDSHGERITGGETMGRRTCRENVALGEEEMRSFRRHSSVNRRQQVDNGRDYLTRCAIVMN